MYFSVQQILAKAVTSWLSSAVP